MHINEGSIWKVIEPNQTNFQALSLLLILDIRGNRHDYRVRRISLVALHFGDVILEIEDAGGIQNPCNRKVGISGGYREVASRRKTVPSKSTKFVESCCEIT